MLKTTAEEYSKFLNLDLGEKLSSIFQSVDDMLTRLEEFESILLCVQQERCNAVDLTGSLTLASQNFAELNELYARIDALGGLIEHIEANVEALEKKVDVAEEQLGLVDNTSKIMNLIFPLFKKGTIEKEPNASVEREIFSTNMYFHSEGSTEEEDKQK